LIGCFAYFGSTVINKSPQKVSMKTITYSIAIAFFFLTASFCVAQDCTSCSHSPQANTIDNGGSLRSIKDSKRRIFAGVVVELEGSQALGGLGNLIVGAKEGNTKDYFSAITVFESPVNDETSLAKSKFVEAKSELRIPITPKRLEIKTSRDSNTVVFSTPNKKISQDLRVVYFNALGIISGKIDGLNLVEFAFPEEFLRSVLGKSIPDIAKFSLIGHEGKTIISCNSRELGSGDVLTCILTQIIVYEENN
jgi:hypothetical protein